MCEIPSSPSMASPPTNNNPQLKISNPKSLNPRASPFQKLNKKNSPFNIFPQEMTYILQPQLPLVQPLPVVPQPIPGVVFYPPPPNHYYHQESLSWAYPQPIVAPAVNYNTHKQLSPETNTMAYFGENVNEESSMDNMNTGPVVMGNMKNDNPIYGYNQQSLEVLGTIENKRKNWVLKNVNVGPRLRSERCEKSGYSNAEKIWVPKNNCDDGLGSHFNEKSDAGGDGVNLDGKTSLMIRNIPNQLERHHLMDILDKHCLQENRKAKLQSDPNKSEYDFLYLRMDFGKRANCGYAFVNFTNSSGALRFTMSFHKYDWDVSYCKKACEISCAEIQGKDALRSHFKNKVFSCHTNRYLPVVFSPPRNGLIQSRPFVIGRRRGRGIAAAVNQKL